MATKKKTRARGSKTKDSGTSGPLRSASVTAIRKELRRRLADLERRRDALAKELHTVETEIAAFEVESGLAARPRPKFGRGPSNGRPSKKKRGARRHRNATSLVEALRKVLRRRTLSVTDLAEAVQKLYNDSQLRENLAVNAQAAAPKHSREVQAQQMMTVFEKALGHE